jgi:hypothetical protein
MEEVGGIGIIDRAENCRIDLRCPLYGELCLGSERICSITDAGCLEIVLREDVLADSIVADCARCLADVFPVLEGSYGFVSLEQDVPRGSALIDEWIPGIFWVTVFGPDMIEHVGKERFDRLPPEYVRHLADGSVLIKVADTLEEYRSKEAQKIIRRIKRTLGRRHFRLPFYRILDMRVPRFLRRKVPKFRNMRVVESDK